MVRDLHVHVHVGDFDIHVWVHARAGSSYSVQGDRDQCLRSLVPSLATLIFSIARKDQGGW